MEVARSTRLGLSLPIIPHRRLSVCALFLTFAIIPVSIAADFNFPDSKQGHFAKSLQSFEITYPSLVTSSGDFLSHSVHFRSKRDTNLQTKDNEDLGDLSYNISIGDDTHHVRLVPNHRLFAPGLVVERRAGGNISDHTYKLLPGNRCHYIGKVSDVTNSVAALATCDGLHGFIRTQKGDYFIEPVMGHDLGGGERHPHLVYHSSDLPADTQANIPHAQHKDGKSCGVDEVEKATADRERWERDTRGNYRDEDDKLRRRRKRSISLERNVETLVVVDPKMMEYYKNDDIETYVLTIFNMVTTMYHDTTIGNAVNIVLVKILLLEEDEKDLKITHHADNTLDSFCKWQMSINPKEESHPNHHDVAVLLTRYNICSKMNEPCSTLGLAQVSGLCQPHRTCNINEDTGLALAYTVAHELGHNFAMQHDGSSNGCLPKEGDRIHIMSPQLSAEAAPLVWSNCSRKYITSFLDRDWGYCLDDEPSEHDFQFPELPAGVMYDADHQCRLQYGPEATYCKGIDDICKMIWCKVNNKCVTRLEAGAEGTICDDNKWCFAGQCVDIGEKPQAIDGQWGVWGGWTSCSRSCGAGVSYAERHCDNPHPSSGGKYCLGERKRYKICNVEDCPDPENNPSFHQVQCSEFNTVPYKGHIYKWESVLTVRTPCQLHCKPEGRFFSVMLQDMVTDGTPCRPGRKDMCISGRCRTVGCDWKIDSAAKEDRCGVCHGDGSSCKTVKQKFDDKVGLGYVEAMVIPEGARNIRVEEVAEANNYLAVRNVQGKYYLNGHWFIQWSGDYEAAGTTIHYQRDGNKEKFIAPGPLKEELHVMLLFQSKNPGVSFEFTVPNENSTAQRVIEYRWKYDDWTHCTVSCGGGYQVSAVLCVEMEGGTVVEERFCNKSTKPDDMAKSCNAHLCPARWWVGPWQHCSVTCGNNGTRKRTVLCVRSYGPNHQIALEDHECSATEKPLMVDSCRHKAPCEQVAFWKQGPWSQTCTGDPCAVQTRIVKCSSSYDECDQAKKPTTKRLCSNKICGSWTTTEWSKCTRTCGGGIQYRSVTCEGGHVCPHQSQPASEQDCNTHACGSPTHTPASASSTASGGTTELISGEVAMTSTEPSTSTLPADSTADNDQTSLQSLDMKKLRYLKDREYRKKGPAARNNPLPTESPEEEMIPYDKNHRWMPLFWGTCSKPCGDGVKTRRILCMNTKTWEEVRPRYCKGQKSPPSEMACKQDACIMWQYGEWQPCASCSTFQCTTTCGNGIQKRHVQCPQPGKCDPDKEPDSIRSCPNLPQCTAWITGSWSQCTRSCGGGSRLRHVQCTDSITGQPASGCDAQGQPTTTEQCSQNPCPPQNNALEGSDDHCKADVMTRAVCRSLEKMGQCVQRYVQLKCCRTCLHSRQKSLHKSATS